MLNLSLKNAATSVDGSVRREIDRRLAYTLGRFEGSIDRVHVRLEDVNGPRGGNDKEVRIETVLRGARDIMVTQRAEDWRVAIGLAADRLGRNISRELRRRKDRQTRGQTVAGHRPLSRLDRAQREAELYEAARHDG